MLTPEINRQGNEAPEPGSGPISPPPEAAPQNQTPARTISITAILSLLFGLLSYLLIPAIPAIVTGLVALTTIKKSNGRLWGRGVAMAGLVLGAFFLFVYSGLIIFASLSGLSREGIIANEISAVGDLETLARAESAWKNNDIDRNGTKDFWTYDVSCFYRLTHADNASKVALIDISLARADFAPADYQGGEIPFGLKPQIEKWIPYKNYKKPKNGYYFQALELDENNRAYKKNEVGTNRIRAAHTAKFAFAAFPAAYAKSGVRTFIINETGLVYGTDTSGWNDGRILKWPARDPAQVIGPGGQGWLLIKE